MTGSSGCLSFKARIKCALTKLAREQPFRVQCTLTADQAGNTEQQYRRHVDSNGRLVTFVLAIQMVTKLCWTDSRPRSDNATLYPLTCNLIDECLTWNWLAAPLLKTYQLLFSSYNLPQQHSRLSTYFGITSVGNGPEARRTVTKTQLLAGSRLLETSAFPSPCSHEST